MKFFIPEWDDRVDPGYDFINDRHSAAHDADPMTNDVYMWGLSTDHIIPFDGLLVSIATLEDNPRKLSMLQKAGIHRFFNLPPQYKIMADCGAFSYVENTVPPYDPIDILELYSKLGFDYGVSVDHLVVPQFAEQNADRMRITYENGLKSYDVWSKKYKDDFQLIVAVQGDKVEDYLDMYEKYLDNGIDHMAFGSLVRKQTQFIASLINQLCERVRSSERKPVHLHFFGIARIALLPKFKELEELGITISFDSASFLRKAWLSAASSQSNYITYDGVGYTAIRVPIDVSGAHNPQTIKAMRADVLSQLRHYDRGDASLEDVISNLNAFCKATNQPEKIIDLYRRTLTDRPWKKCPCPICREIGIEVTIFRGNNRNRRRGFHNVYSFYNILKSEDLWEKIIEKKSLDKLCIPMKYAEDLDFLKGDKGKVLIITGCSKKKLNSDGSMSAKAKDMYEGTIFRFIRRYAERMSYDYVIISAKYGLLFPDQIIDGYDQVIRTRGDIERLKPIVERELRKVIKKYDKIVVIAGAKYRDVLVGLWDDRFVYLKSGGIGELCSIVKRSTPRIDRTLDSFY